MKNQRKAFVLASMNMDLTVSSTSSPKLGETIEGSDFFMNTGGKGGNEAIAIAKQNVPVYIVANIGKDVFGNYLLNSLKPFKNLKTQYINQIEGGKTGTAMILVENANQRIVMVPGVNRKMNNHQIDNALSDACENDILLSQLEINLDAVEYGMKMAKMKKMITVLNIAPFKKLDKAIYQYVDYLIVNSADFEKLFGIEINENKIDFASCEKAYNDLGVKFLIILINDYGQILVNKEGTIKKNAIKVNAIDKTASRGTFTGVFVSQLIKEKSVSDSLKVASYAAALCSLKRGASKSIPDENELNEFMKKYDENNK